jgi:hypothetical protein
MGFFDNKIDKVTPKMGVPSETDVTEVSLSDEDTPEVKPQQQENITPETEPSEDIVVEEPQPDSSLTTPQEEPEAPQPETQPEVSTPEPAAEVEVTEEMILQSLSEKLGREINSFEDLTPEPAQVVEEDPYIKELKEWREKTGRPIEDWIKFQKDYDSMSSIDVAREYLQYRYPDLNNEELELELSRFTPDEDDESSDVTRKNLELKKLATDARKTLKELKSEFSTPVQSETTLSKEQQEAINFYNQYKEEYAKSQQVSEANAKGIQNQIQSLEKIPLQLDSDLSIDFVVPGDKKSKLGEFTNMDHWKNKDGSTNYSAVVSDYAFLQNKEAIIKLAYEQGVAKGKADDDKAQRNITLDARQTADTGQGDTGDKIIVEGLDDYLGRGTKVRFGSHLK